MLIAKLYLKTFMINMENNFHSKNIKAQCIWDFQISLLLHSQIPNFRKSLILFESIVFYDLGISNKIRKHKSSAVKHSKNIKV